MQVTLCSSCFAFALVIALAATVCGREVSDGPAVKAPQGHVSPKEAFEAYRQSIAAGDWVARFRCLTPESRKWAVFDAAFVAHSAMPHNDRMRAILDKYGYDDEKIGREYARRYKEKYDIDLEQIEAEQKKRQDQLAAERAERQDPNELLGDEAAPADPTLDFGAEREPVPPPRDAELLLEVIWDHIADKPGFIQAVTDAVGAAGEDKRPPGELKDVSIQGDAAKGRAAVFSRAWVARGAEEPQPVETRQETIFHFRKTNEGWLIDAHLMELDNAPPIVPVE